MDITIKAPEAYFDWEDKIDSNECSLDIDDKICFSDNVIQAYSNKLEKDGFLIDKDNSDKEAVVDKMLEITGCNTQICILESNKTKPILPEYLVDKEYDRFKVEGPANTTEWLSDSNIEKILIQLARKYKHFYYFPYQMIDFALFDTKFAKANYPKLISAGYTQFGVVINTDRWSRENSTGLHWFVIVIDAKTDKKTITIEYFNSSGNPPQKEILIWFTKTKIHIENVMKDRKVEFTQITNRQIQFDDHSCGVYCLFYIYSRLKGILHSKFANKSNNVNDNIVLRFRKFLFRERNKYNLKSISKY